MSFWEDGLPVLAVFAVPNDENPPVLSFHER
jgi:hypothetical protein